MHGRAGSSNIAQACRTTKDLEKTAGNATVFMACSLPMLFISAVQSRVGSGRDQCCCCHFIDRQSKTELEQLPEAHLTRYQENWEPKADSSGSQLVCHHGTAPAAKSSDPAENQEEPKNWPFFQPVL